MNEIRQIIDTCNVHTINRQYEHRVNEKAAVVVN